MKRSALWSLSGFGIVSISILAVFSSSPVLADCIDYGRYIHWTGSVETPGSARDIAVAGNYAYIAESLPSPPGLQVVDISDPTAPRNVGRVSTPLSLYGVTVAGAYAYVTDGDGNGAGHLLDVSYPSSPQVVGSVSTPGEANGIALSGNYAYVGEENADGSGQLQVIGATSGGVLSRRGFIWLERRSTASLGS